MHLAVAGAGFVGLATAVGFARHGCPVTIFDVDRDRLARLRSGELPFHEPSLEGTFRWVLRDTLEIADGPLPDSPGRSSRHFDLAFNCVGTPPLPDGSLDLAAVREVARTVVAMSEGRTAVVNRSTVPPGTAAALEAELREQYPAATVIANPEFLREGTALADFDHPPRRVIGGSPGDALETLADLYSFSDAPLITTDATSAELIKVGANAALALRVSMANEIADVATALGADAEAVLSAIGTDPRIGRHYLSPGIGFGGMCLPKDLDAYRAAGRSVKARTNVFDGAATTNRAAPERLADRVMEALRGAEAQVCVAGVAFKEGSDQTRGSQAIRLVEALLDRGLHVSVCDPLAEANARELLGEHVRYLPSLHPLPESHGVVVFTQGPDRRALEQLPEHVIALDGLGREIHAREWSAAK